MKAMRAVIVNGNVMDGKVERECQFYFEKKRAARCKTKEDRIE